MTTEEEALITKLLEGPVNEADLDEQTIEAAKHLVGRNVTVSYPLSDGTEGRQWELTHMGSISAESPQPEEKPSEPDEPEKPDEPHEPDKPVA